MTHSPYHHPTLSQSYADMLTPGVQVELDAGDAEALGVCLETALSPEDAWASNGDPVAEG